MDKKQNYFKKRIKALSSLAFAVATAAANTRCAYIYHNPDKSDELQQLKKF